MQAMGRFLVTVIAPVFVVVGLHCGIVMPDIDQRTNLLLHRSIITHSPLIPLILLLLALRIGFGLYAFAMGISISFAVHHAFDLFPKGWTGAALISIPLYGWTPWLFSWIWIAFSTLACAYLAARLVQGRLDRLWYLLGFIYIFILTAPKEHTWFGPVVALVIAVIVLGRMVLFRRAKNEV